MSVELSKTGRLPVLIWASLLVTGCYHPPHERTPQWDLANGEERPDRLTAHQRRADVMPDSPSEFSPDAGIAWPSEPRNPVFEIKEETIVTEVAPLPPAEFNPDPGMGATDPAENPGARGAAGRDGNPLTNGRFFKEDPGGFDDRFFSRDAGVPKEFPKFEPKIDDEFQLPRQNVESRRLEAEMVDAGGLPELYVPDMPGDLLLPRKDVRFEERIYEHWHAGHHEHVEDAPNTTSVENRWRVKTGEWERYLDGTLAETPYKERTPYLWHPYYQSLLKGDLPVVGQDIFASITLLNTTDIEFRNIPVPSGVSTAEPFSSEFYGNGEQISINSNTGLLIDVFRGETSFKPVEWLFRIQPVFNTNYVSVNETGLVSPDPRGLDQNTGNPPDQIGGNPGDIDPGDIDGILDEILNPRAGSRKGRATNRFENHLALQQFFLETHLLDLSGNYDFAALRIGTQTFNADFRGHVYLDSNWGYRLFGNLRKNQIQYNLAFFDLFEKESFSELNTFDDRNQNVFVANLYWQDFIFEGYTAQWSFLANWDRGSKAGLIYDSAGSIVRPSPIGTVAPHDIDAYYLGWSGEGHIGRMNISHSLYHVFGEDDLNGVAGRGVDISAWMAALEVSVDTDWMRHKFTIFYGSGDDDATDGTAKGWDAIVDNPNFAGGPFSYWNRQGFNLGGSAVALKQRLSLIPDLSSNKFLGQSNFVNPGIFIAGVGEEWELTPRARFFANLNYLMFVNTDSISSALVTDGIAKEIGWDLSFGFEYRPFLTDNLRLTTGLGMLFPGDGYKDVYRTTSPGVPGFTPVSSKEVDDVLCSGFFTAIMTF